MTLYDQTRITKLEYTSTIERSITSENQHKRWYLCFVEAPLK